MKVPFLTSAITVFIMFSSFSGVVAEPRNVTDFAEEYWNFIWYDRGLDERDDPANFAMGEQERGFIFQQTTHYPQQHFFAGVTDAIIENYQKYPVESLNEGGTPPFKVPAYIMHAVHYPQNTGNLEVDRVLADFALARYNSRLPLPQGMEDGWYPVDQWFYITTYIISRSGPDFMSVVFLDCFYIGGNAMAAGPYVLNLDLKQGRVLEFTDIVSNPDVALPLIHAKLSEYRSHLTEGGDTKINIDYAQFYNILTNYQSSKKREPIVHMLFDPQGLVFLYDNWVLEWKAPVILTIPKDELETVGVNTRFWD